MLDSLFVKKPIPNKQIRVKSRLFKSYLYNMDLLELLESKNNIEQPGNKLSGSQSRFEVNKYVVKQNNGRFKIDLKNSNLREMG